jgi:hypothetical protein
MHFTMLIHIVQLSKTKRLKPQRKNEKYQQLVLKRSIFAA